MKFYSTKGEAPLVEFKDAILTGLPPDNGLYMPQKFGILDKSIFAIKDFPTMAFEAAKVLLDGAIPDADLRKIIDKCYTFDVPVVNIHDNVNVLELYHGPTCAFKDFGARFMANTMSYFLQSGNRKVNILVATSGDTGSAVANGFYNVDNINVVILYPSGKVSNLQEKQLTTLGNNITAFEIDGTFDDCQKIVKTAFLDSQLAGEFNLSSANSINIGRLYPQSFYYIWAYNQLIGTSGDEIVFCTPSGNFGNLTAGLIAKRMGLPVKKFIAATNVNDVVPEYLFTGTYTPRPSQRTLSNAMDVGAPSNFMRMTDMYKTVDAMRADIVGYKVTDEETRATIHDVYERCDYMLDPHGAVGYNAVAKYITATGESAPIVLLETAHPAKFGEIITDTLGVAPNIPPQLQACLKKDKVSVKCSKEYEEFKGKVREYLIR